MEMNLILDYLLYFLFQLLQILIEFFRRIFINWIVPFWLILKIFEIILQQLDLNEQIILQPYVQFHFFLFEQCY